MLVKEYGPIWLTGTALDDDQFGGSMVLLPDLNSDGILDLAVGAPAFSFEKEDGSFIKEVGVFTTFNMKRNGGWKGYSFVYGCDYGYDIWDRFGCSLAPIRDLNNDTNYELAVGAYNADGGGAITIIFRNSETHVGACSEDDDVFNNTKITPESLGTTATATYFGYSMASPYYFNETAFDLVVGGSTADGDVRFIKFDAAGGADVTWLLSAATLDSYFEQKSYHVGSAVAVLPDMDGNGALELLVGMQNYGGGAGGLLLLFMDRGYRTVKRTTIITRNSLSRFLSTGAGLGASISLVSHNVSTVVVAVGAPLDNYHSGSTTFTESGSVVVLYLAMDGSVEKDYRISDLRNVQDLTSAALSPSTGAHFGSAVAGVSDLDQDGSSDLFVGSSGSGCCGAFVELFMEYDPAANFTFHSSSPTPQPTYYNFNKAASLGAALFVWVSVSLWACCVCTYALFRWRRNQLILHGAAAANGGSRSARNNGSALTAAEIAAIPEMTYATHLLSVTPEDEAESCSICLESFEKEHRVKKLPCNHLYHPDCIDVCLQNSPLCPLCRGNVREPTPTTPTGANAQRQQLLGGTEIEMASLGPRSSSSLSSSGDTAEDSSPSRGASEPGGVGSSSSSSSAAAVAGGRGAAAAATIEVSAVDTSGHIAVDQIDVSMDDGNATLGLLAQCEVGLSGGVSTSAPLKLRRSLYANCDTSDEEEEGGDDNDEEAARRVATEQSRNLTLTPGVFREEI